MIEVIAEHSVDTSLLKRDSKVLDLGCRAFSFTNEILKYVDHVYAVDADSDVKTDNPKVSLLNVGVGHEPGVEKFIKFGNGTGNYFYKGEPLPAEHTAETVQVWTIPQICKWFEVEYFDLIKFDIEGNEWAILANLQHPIARQITFEMHQHTVKKVSDEDIETMFNNLSKWYNIEASLTDQHGCGFNYWDCLAILK